jgi:hypothetical protein
MLRASDGSFSDYGPMIDRRRIKALGVEIMQSEAPIVIEGQAFTTGAVPRTSIERVLPNSWVEFGVKTGLAATRNPMRTNTSPKRNYPASRSLISTGTSTRHASASAIGA